MVRGLVRVCLRKHTRQPLVFPRPVAATVKPFVVPPLFEISRQKKRKRVPCEGVSDCALYSKLNCRSGKIDQLGTSIHHCRLPDTFSWNVSAGATVFVYQLLVNKPYASFGIERMHYNKKLLH